MQSDINVNYSRTIIVLLFALACWTTNGYADKPTVTIDRIEGNSGIITIHYTTTEPEVKQLVTADWGYSTDGGQTWLSIDTAAIGNNAPKKPGSSTITWDTTVGTNNLAGKNYPSVLFKMRAYDPNDKGYWRTVTPMPTARVQLAAAVVDGKIYAIGGYNNGVLLPTVEMYNPLTNAWQKVADMPTARFRLDAAAVDGKIYAIGGEKNGILSIVEMYNPLTNAWQKVADMLTARLQFASAVVDEKIYAIGGNGGFSTVEAYAPLTDTWQKVADMPTERALLTSAVVDGRIYAIGGSKDYQRRSTVEMYDPLTDAWQKVADMPTARSGLAAAVVDGKIYVIGGQDDERFSIVEMYNPLTDTWYKVADMPTARTRLAAAVVNGKIFAIGGQINNEISTSNVEEFTPPLYSDITLSDYFGLPSGSAAPIIMSIAPNYGSVCGGTQVIIKGDGFQEGTTVSIGGSELTDVSVFPEVAASITSQSIDISDAAPDNVALRITLKEKSTPEVTGSIIFSTDSTVAPSIHMLKAFVDTSIANIPDLAGKINVSVDGTNSAVAVTFTSVDKGDGVQLSIEQIAGSDLLFSTIVNDGGQAEIIGTTSPGDLGLHDVVVTNPGGRKDTLAHGFAYMPLEGDCEIKSHFEILLTKGVNLISLPLRPDNTYTASTLAEELSSTIIIRSHGGAFQVYVPEGGYGLDFPIEPGKGYIVNVLKETKFSLTGRAWGTTVPSAPPTTTTDTWAFVVVGSLEVPKGASILFTNHRTGQNTIAHIDASGIFVGAFVDLTKHSVVGVGDEISLQILDNHGNVIGQQKHRITNKQLTSAYLLSNLRAIPPKTLLFQNYPNPFNPETWIPYQLDQNSEVTITIYNAKGQIIRAIDLGRQVVGSHLAKGKAVYWDGRDNSGQPIASGVYFYTLRTGKYSATRRMLIVK